MNALHGWINLEFVYSLGWALVHSLWQATAIAVLLAIMLRLTRHWSSNSRYLLSGTAFICVFICTLFTFNDYFKTLRYGLTLDPATLWPMSQTAHIKQSILSQTHQLLNNHIFQIVALWAIGFVVLFTRHCGAWLYCQRLKTTLSHQAPPKWQQKLNTQVKRIGIRRDIVIRLTCHIRVPCVIGQLKPAVLLPTALLTRLSTCELEMILLHELAHIRRHDYLLGLIQSLLKTLFFFNPAALWISRQIDGERENACDDIAADTSNNRLLYAKTLALFSELTHQGEFTMAITGKQHLKHRIQRLFTPHNTTRNPLQGVVSCLTMSVCAALLSVQVTATEALTDYSEIHSLNNSEVQQLINDYKASIYSGTSQPNILTTTETLPGYGALTRQEQSVFSEYLEQALWDTSYANIEKGEMHASLTDEQWLNVRKWWLKAR